MPHSELLDWAPEDRAKLIAWLIESGAKCPTCGTADWEWEEDRYAYEPILHQCHGCYLREISSEEAQGVAGGRMALVPKEVAKRMREQPVRAPGMRQ